MSKHHNRNRNRTPALSATVKRRYPEPEPTTAPPAARLVPKSAEQEKSIESGVKRPFSGVLGLYDGVDNGCSFYRLIQPYAELNGIGQPFEWLSMDKDPVTGQTASQYVQKDFDGKHYSIVSLLRPVVTLLNEVDKPVSAMTLEVMDGLIGNVHATGALFCGDLDDDMWAVATHNPAHESLGEYTPDRIKETLRRLDFVTCSTPFLAKRIHEISGIDKIDVVPNMIDFNQYDRTDWELPVPGKPGETQMVDMGLVRKNRMAAKGDNGRPIVIGLQGGPSHIEDWRIVSPVLKAVAERYGDKVRFVIGGSHFDYMREDLAEATAAGLVWWKEWITFLLHSETVMQFDINLCPLEDTLFNRSKSGIKWMEGCAAGAVTIASPTVYQAYVQHGKTGFIARSATDWLEAICLLIERPDIRRFIARNAHLVVRSHYNLESGVFQWNNIYNKRWQELGGKVSLNMMEQAELAEMSAMAYMPKAEPEPEPAPAGQHQNRNQDQEPVGAGAALS